MSTSEPPDGPDQSSPAPDLDLPARRADQARMTRDALKNEWISDPHLPERRPGRDGVHVPGPRPAWSARPTWTTVEGRLFPVRGERDWGIHEAGRSREWSRSSCPRRPTWRRSVRRPGRLPRPGIAMPEHVVHITPAGCCPATEPNRSWQPRPAPSSPPTRWPPARRPGRRHRQRSPPGRGGRPLRVAARHHRRRRSDPGVGHYVGHGTFVCGVLRSQAPECDIDVNAVNVLAGVGGREHSLVSTSGGDQARPAGPHLDVGRARPPGRAYPPIALEAVVCVALGEAGILLVAAAGNEGRSRSSTPPTRRPSRPGRWQPNVVAVGALDR